VLSPLFNAKTTPGTGNTNWEGRRTWGAGRRVAHTRAVANADHYVSNGQGGRHGVQSHGCVHLQRNGGPGVGNVQLQRSQGVCAVTGGQPTWVHPGTTRVPRCLKVMGGGEGSERGYNWKQRDRRMGGGGAPITSQQKGGC
jgi:hypothetical protein